jgi:quercetin dioxygenase-like cupin family protein
MGVGVRQPSIRLAAAVGALSCSLLLLVRPGLAAPGAQAPSTQASGIESPGIESRVLASRTLIEVPDGRRWAIRAHHPLDEDAHAHAGGFIYAAAGQSILVVQEAQGIIMQEGQAAWAPEDIAHLHRSQTRTSSQGYGVSAPGVEIWAIELERQSEARQPGALAMSPPLRGIMPGLYEARLVSETYQPGASSVRRQRTGPELAYLLNGSWELTYDGVTFPITGPDAYLADPGVPHQLRNVGAEAGRLLSTQLIPDGRPAEEPAP